jgi:hypothetical protein
VDGADPADATSPSKPVSNPLDDPEFVAGLRTVPTGDPGEAPEWPAADILGTRPDGSPATIDLAHIGSRLLLVFLTAQCDGCAAFWSGLADRSDPALSGVVPVVVTRGPDSVDAAEVAALASELSGDVVMSDPAWTDYRVTGYPFLVLVDPAGRRILAESVGFDWADVARTVRGGLAAT